MAAAAAKALTASRVESFHSFSCVSLRCAFCCLLQASKSFYDNKEDLLQLWVHETFRVIGDRMWDPADQAWLRKQVDERLSASFSTSFAGLFEEFNEQVGPGCRLAWA